MANKISDLTKTLKTNSKGYNYKYTDLAGIHEALAEAKISYWQEIVTNGGKDYIKTHVIDDETGEELRAGLGAEIVEANEINGKMNPAQALGASITYARRYSLLLILGLATEDDDAESLTKTQTEQPSRGSYKRLDFDEIRENLKVMDDMGSVDEYAIQVAAEHPKMTEAQKDTVKRIFDTKRREFI